MRFRSESGCQGESIARFRVEQTVQDGQRVFTISRKKSAAGKSVLYIHGGAYVNEIMGTQWKTIGKLLKLSDLSVTVPLYPLAPEHTVEKALTIVSAIYEKMLQRADGEPVVFLGESSGGGMALALAQQLRDANRPQPASLVLLSPWLDVTCSDPSQDVVEKLDPILARAGFREEGRWYTGALSPRDPCVSPLFGNLEGLPPMLLLTGTHDLLHADATRLQTKLAEAKALKALTYPDMLHVWPSMPIPEFFGKRRYAGEVGREAWHADLFRVQSRRSHPRTTAPPKLDKRQKSDL